MAGRQKRGKANPGPKPQDVQRAQRIGEPVSDENPRQHVPYSDSWEKEFLSRVMETGAGPKVICEAADMPQSRTVYGWLAAKPDFAGRYTKAKMLGIQHRFADEIIEISDDNTRDIVMRLGYNGAEPKPEVNGEVINRSKLRVDSRKWLLAKLFPSKYGDNQKIELSGSLNVVDRLAAGRKRVAELRKQTDGNSGN